MKSLFLLREKTGPGKRYVIAKHSLEALDLFGSREKHTAEKIEVGSEIKNGYGTFIISDIPDELQSLAEGEISNQELTEFFKRNDAAYFIEEE